MALPYFIVSYIKELSQDYFFVQLILCHGNGQLVLQESHIKSTCKIIVHVLLLCSVVCDRHQT